MSKAKWYHKSIYALLALALVLSLGIVALPMAGTVGANGTPPTFTFSGDSLTADLGPWGGTGYVYPLTFDVTASPLDITFYDVDGSLLENDNGTTPWYEALKGVGMPGLTAGTSITSIDPPNNSVFWIMVNLNSDSDTDWNSNPVSTLGPDGTCFTSDDTRHWGFQDWYRPATGGKIEGAGEDPYYNPESYVTPNDRFTTAPAHDASFYNTFDLRIKITHTGDDSYNYEMWVRMHNCASVEEGCSYCGCGVYNHAINNCGEDDAWRQLADGGTTVFSMSDIDLSAVHPFVGLGNYPIPATHTLTWGDVVVTGTPTPQAEVWVDDGWSGLSPGDPAGGHTFGYDAFAAIQDGIDAVAEDGTVNVAAGTYNERIVINKDNLTLLGAQHDVDPRPVSGGRSDDESIIAPYYDFNVYTGLEAIRIEADNVVLNGFKISPEFSPVVSGDVDTVYQHDAYSGTVVKYNIVTCTGDITYSDEAIQLKQCTNGVIEYNYVYNFKGNGFNFASSTDCTIQYNEAHDCGQGLDDRWDGTIYTYKSTNIDVIGNVIYSAYADGITFGGLVDWPGKRNTGGAVKDNIVNGSALDGLEVYADDVLVEGNEVSDCGGNAIKIIGANVIVQTNDLYGNNVGILVKDQDSISPTGASAHWNNIEGNTQYGINNEATEIVDATNNWWGDASGPSSSPTVYDP